MLKQDQLKLKRERKTKEINKPSEVMSLTSENKVNLKERIREKRKDSDSIKRERKKSIKTESGEKKIRMR
jgi:hypothetical protein